MPRLRLRHFPIECAGLVSSWAPTAGEVWTWVSRTAAPVPPDVIGQWAAEQDSLTFLAEIDGEPVGFGQIWLDEDEEDAELARLLVAPDRRGQGVGRQLVTALAEIARRHKPSVALRVVPENLAARRAYTAAGFVRVDPDDERRWNEGQPVEFVWMRLADDPGQGLSMLGPAVR